MYCHTSSPRWGVIFSTSSMVMENVAGMTGACSCNLLISTSKSSSMTLFLGTRTVFVFLPSNFLNVIGDRDSLAFFSWFFWNKMAQALAQIKCTSKNFFYTSQHICQHLHFVRIHNDRFLMMLVVWFLHVWPMHLLHILQNNPKFFYNYISCCYSHQVYTHMKPNLVNCQVQQPCLFLQALKFHHIIAIPIL